MNAGEEIDPVDRLEAIIRDMEHTIHNFSVIGPGVSGNVEESFMVNGGIPPDESGTP
jgi:hypothetical protein